MLAPEMQHASTCPTWKTEICCRCAPLVDEALRRPTSELPAFAGFLPARMSFSRFSVACAASKSLGDALGHSDAHAHAHGRHARQLDYFENQHHAGRF